MLEGSFSYLPKGASTSIFTKSTLTERACGKLPTAWDDIEPIYLPDGDIMFCSSRAKRWVQCWLVQVATIHRCGPNGKNIRMISCNMEQDNTPWVLPNGQILYMRWEYVDRNEVSYHHLWVMNPDGTRQNVYFGNQKPGITMIDAKPIPETDKVSPFSRAGTVIATITATLSFLMPNSGRTTRKCCADPDLEQPDNDDPNGYADPWAFSDNLFMAYTMPICVS